MIEFLNNIFINEKFENNFKKHEDTKIDFYYKENQEYFIVSEYSIEDLNDFFRCERTNNIVEFLDKFKKENPGFELVDKDTSLIIALKVSNLKEDFEKTKNQIMKIEEDEYFFRKYVIIYDEKGANEIKNIDTIQKLNDELNGVRDEEGKFIKKGIDLNEFRKDYYKDSKMYLIIQLFVKLPFLTLNVEGKPLQKLIDIINNTIKSKKLEGLNSSILNENLLTLENKKENKKVQKYIEDIKENFLGDDDKKVDNFLNLFTN